MSVPTKIGVLEQKYSLLRDAVDFGMANFESVFEVDNIRRRFQQLGVKTGTFPYYCVTQSEENP